MPGITQKCGDKFGNSNAYCSANGFWSKHADDVSYNQLQKFWSELSPQARQELLRLDKQALFEQARKKMYCSRCHGLLLEGFLQIVMYGKSLQQEGATRHLSFSVMGSLKNRTDRESNMTHELQDETPDPSVHPWGGLTTTRDGALTLLDCYLYSKSLKGLQNVFDSARGRERERELLYPDACGGAGRGWICQGIVGYGRGHGARETCALHSARLSCDTLVDFWSALGEETRRSLLRMKEEDFMERLMYRFDSKRFCRDCRRNVIREFKELKELKRMRRETHCTSWFCVADTAFQYEVSDNTVLADWQHLLTDTFGTYHHFEWAVGTGEGKSDILDFENVGMRGSVQVNGLDLGGLSACYITLRAWKLDGRCTEVCVKAHALKGQPCVHCRLVVGDGFITITKGESIRRFFERAEEAEEDEDDDSMDKDGNELDGECSRPQKHAKSPELAREFLLDAAIVIFKEQVEKAFREGTARQNAHSIFVCLALKLLEERVHVACKEIITLEKQMKLLEEEEKEKREEEERKERKRTKEREKKLRRKERLKGKERNKEKRCSDTEHTLVHPNASKEDESSQSFDEEPSTTPAEEGSAIDTRDNTFGPRSADVHDEHPSSNGSSPDIQNQFHECSDGEYAGSNNSFVTEHSKFPLRRSKLRKDFQLDPVIKWSNRRRFSVTSENAATASKSESRLCGHSSPRGQDHTATKLCGKFRSSSGRMCDRYDFNPCSCDLNYRAKVAPPAVRSGWGAKPVFKSESSSDTHKPLSRANKFNQTDHASGRSKSKTLATSNSSGREPAHLKKVWEPMEPSHKKSPQSSSGSDAALSSSSKNVEPDNSASSSPTTCTAEVTTNSCGSDCGAAEGLKEVRSIASSMEIGFRNGSNAGTASSSDPVSSSSNSNSDNCSSCLSEGDCNTACSNSPNLESSSASDSEDAAQLSEGRHASEVRVQNGFPECNDIEIMEKQGEEVLNLNSRAPSEHFPDGSGSAQTLTASAPEAFGMGSPYHGFLPHQDLHYSMFQVPSTMAYYHQNAVSWPAAPVNGLVPLAHSHHCLFAGSIGYGMNGNSRYCMQYGGPPQQLEKPFPNPVYHPVGAANSDDQTRSFRTANKERVDPSQPSGDDGKTGNSKKLYAGNTNFSLFHFGGPVALSKGHKSSAEELTSSAPCPDRPAGGDAGTTVEEYNLFATGNGLRFSFF